MAKPFENWTVLPHGRITRIEDNILTVTGKLHMPPMGQVERRMTVVRLHDDRLIIYSAIALDEDEMSELETFGTPAYLIVPNDIHRMDAKIWKKRSPPFAARMQKQTRRCLRRLMRKSKRRTFLHLMMRLQNHSVIFWA